MKFEIKEITNMTWVGKTTGEVIFDCPVKNVSLEEEFIYEDSSDNGKECKRKGYFGGTLEENKYQFECDSIMHNKTQEGL